MDDDTLDRLLRALSDTTRRSLLDRLRDTPGLTLGALTAGFALSRQALSKHLAALQAADLVVTLWRGREKLHYLNPAPLQDLPARWVTATPREHNAALAALNKALAAAAPRAAASPLLACLLAPAPATTQVRSSAALAAACSYLTGSADAVRGIAAVLPASAGYTRPPGGGFSLAEHLWHLADLETLGWRPRFERVLREPRPRLPGVDGDRLARERHYQDRPWRGAARRFVAERKRTLQLLARLDPLLLARPLVFAGRASSVGDLLAAMVAHDHEHRLALAERWTTIEEPPR